MSKTRRDKILEGLRLKIKNLKHDVVAREQSNRQLKSENKMLQLEVKQLKAKLLKAKLPPDNDE